MLGSIYKEGKAKIAIVMFLIFSIWWFLVFYFFRENRDINNLFSAMYGIMAVWGGVFGMMISKKWGGLKSVMGRAIFAFSLGLFAQEFGQLTYSYYAYFLKITIPYPSIGDIGYFGSIPLYIYGAFHLGQAAGIKVALKNFTSKIQAVILPLIILFISYAIFLKDYSFDWSKPLIIFFDFGYPLGQTLYVSIALLVYLLSRKVLGGIMKKPVLFILIALFAQYLSDFTYLYQANQGTAYPGGPNDYLYLTAYYLMTLGLIQLNTILTKIRNSAS